MRIEPNGAVPIFQQLVEGVRSAIAAGVYRPGDLIPSVRAQAIASLVNPNTVQRAYEELERQGLIASKKGTGMIVAPSAQAAAQNGALQSIKTAFAQAVEMGRDAGMSRGAIDKTYRAVCSETDWSVTHGRQS